MASYFTAHFGLLLLIYFRLLPKMFYLGVTQHILGHSLRGIGFSFVCLIYNQVLFLSEQGFNLSHSIPCHKGIPLYPLVIDNFQHWDTIYAW